MRAWRRTTRAPSAAGEQCRACCSPPPTSGTCPRAPARPPLAPPPPLTPRLLPAQMSGRVLLMFVFFFQALYAENGGPVTPPSFFGVVTGTRSRCRPHGSASLTPSVRRALAALALRARLRRIQDRVAALILTVTLGVSNIWMYPFWCAAPPPSPHWARAPCSFSPRAARSARVAGPSTRRLYASISTRFFRTLSVMGARPPAPRAAQRLVTRARLQPRTRLRTCPPARRSSRFRGPDRCR